LILDKIHEQLIFRLLKLAIIEKAKDILIFRF